MRPSFDEVYMGLAMMLRARSTCARRQIGTVIVSGDHRKVLAIGYNGNAEGLPNQCDHADQEGACGCLHSEENAIINCDSPRYTVKIVYVTRIPCHMCAKRLINLGGVKEVIWHEERVDRSGLDVLHQAKIPTRQWTPSIPVSR